MDELVRAVGEMVVPLFAIFFIFGLPILAWTFFRVLAHRERMAMIQQGIPPDWKTAPRVPAASKAMREALEPAQVTLTKGVRLACIGLAITIGLSFIGYHGDGLWHPGPWLLGGLIPLFIGIAQILVALISGATFGPNLAGPRGQAPYTPNFGPAMPQPPPPNPNPTTFDGSYTYRPGSTEQLRPPTSPPERR